MRSPHRRRPVVSPHRVAPPEPAEPLEPELREELLFCAICQVSIAAGEIEGGQARQTPRGRTFCAICAASTPDERKSRRDALEAEFADDAPVVVRRLPPVAPRPPQIVRPPVASAPASAAPSPPSAPTVVVRAAPDPVIDARVGELERSCFRLQARLARVEERLEEILRRLG